MEDGGERHNPDAVPAHGGTGMRAIFSVRLHRGQVLPREPAGPRDGVAMVDEKPPHDRSTHAFRGIWTVRGFLLLQIAIFLALVSIHFGLPIGGYRHENAGTTESVIVAA